MRGGHAAAGPAFGAGLVHGAGAVGGNQGHGITLEQLKKIRENAIAAARHSDR
jgi:hypothetical protein